MSLGSHLARLLDLLDDVRGYLVVRSRRGVEYVVGRRSEFERRSAAEPALDTASDEAARLDRELTDWQLAGEEGSPPLMSDQAVEFPPAAKRVTFEPLHGDLPPELQE